MSSVVPASYIENILSCGYLREYEYLFDIQIPDGVQSMIAMYCKYFVVYGIGCNNNRNEINTYKRLNRMTQLIANVDDIFVNGYGVNIKSVLNELYVTNNNNLFQSQYNKCDINNINNINLMSSGIANNTELYIYTVRNKLYRSTVHKENNNNNNNNNNIFNEIDTRFLLSSFDCIIDIKCGLNHTLFLTNLGNVYSMGLNDVGQCGFNADKYPNIQRGKLMIQNIICIDCGAFHNLLINNKYELIVCGYNYCGQLGVSTKMDIINTTIPTIYQQERIQHYIQENNEENHDNDNDNDNNDDDDDDDDELGAFQLADTSDDDDDSDCNWNDWNDDDLLLSVDIPIINKYFNDLHIKIIKICAAKFHSLCIASNGKCYSFGQNAFGNLGNGEISEWGQSNANPQEIIMNNNGYIIDGSCGENHNLLLTKTNDIICFGDNSNHQCSKINKNKIITPYILSKEKEFGLSSKNCFVEKVICLKNESLIFVDQYKKERC